MKKYFLILSIFFIACASNSTPIITKADTTFISYKDTIPINKHNTDSLQKVIDTLASRLLHAKLVIRNVKHYVDICKRNPSQSKFLLGWVSRAIE